ncbi:hypothetical protein DXG01_005013 [Tephrocybe rancida]|nr:hypothetical protein DXG01_005013 [Tephrocybe rancida]
MATPASAVRKSKQVVYVDVPRSPYPTTLSFSHKSATLTSLTLKENTPLRPSNGGVTRAVSDLHTLKRKTSEQDISSTNSVNAKKQKLVELPAALLPQPPAANASAEFPNGFVYCHQCSHKRDAAASVYCSSVKTAKGTGKQCTTKFCASCLKNRYGEHADEIKALAVNGIYTFKCVTLNNYRCVARNLSGVLGVAIYAPVGGAGSSKAFLLLVRNPKPTLNANALNSSKPIPKHAVEVLITTTPLKAVSSKVPTATKTIKPETAKIKPTVAKAKTETSKQQTLQQMIPQVLPVLKWTEVPTILDIRDAESRFQIREFVLRFASVMEPSIPRVLLAELEDLGCGSDDEEMAPWVSEACVRSMILGFLGMLASLEGDTQKLVKSVARDIRATGNNLNKIWPILAKLRDSLADDAELSFPDPLPPPTSATIHNTRTTRSAWESNVTIGHSAQMIPVVEALISATLETPMVREALEGGVRDAKEMVREVQKATREENDRWDTERKLLEAEREKEKEASEKDKDDKPKIKVAATSKAVAEIKARREVHKIRIRDLEYALKLVTPGFAPRFAPLGTDTTGRTFWASSPGIVERKTALDFLNSATTSTSKKAKTKVHVANDSTPKEWSWFLAVWGKKIPGHAKAPADEDNDEGVERWWAFSEPLEIRKLADWIRIDAGIDPYGEVDANKPLALLVKGLNDYAALLDWRLKEDKYV